jgi:hypothetical protein
LKKPSDARSRKYKIWGDLYDKIFASSAIEPYVISFLLHQLAVQWLKCSGSTESPHDVTRRLANNGAFHVARIAAFRWRGGDEWGGKTNVFPAQIDILEKTPGALDKFLEMGLTTLDSIITNNPQFAHDIDGAMKSNLLDAEIDKHLYTRK